MSAIKVLEKDIEKKIVAYAKSKGCIVRKFTSPSCRGVVDRTVLTPHGVTGYLEVKRPGNKPTTLQTKELNALRGNKAPADWKDSVEKGKAFVDYLLTFRLIQVEEEI